MMPVEVPTNSQNVKIEENVRCSSSDSNRLISPTDGTTRVSRLLSDPKLIFSLFYDPPEVMLWNKRPMWSLAKMFTGDDDTDSTLCSDMRNSLVMAKNATFATESWPSPKLFSTVIGKIAESKKAQITKELIGEHFPNHDDGGIKILKRQVGERKREFKRESEFARLEGEINNVVKSMISTNDMSIFGEMAVDKIRSYLRQCNEHSVEIFVGESDDLTATEIKSRFCIKMATDLSSHSKSIPKPEEKTQKEKKNYLPVYRDAKSLTQSVVDSIAKMTKPKEPAVRPAVTLRDVYRSFLNIVRECHEEFISEISNCTEITSFLKLPRDNSVKRTKIFYVDAAFDFSLAGLSDISKECLFREFMSIGMIERVGKVHFNLKYPMETPYDTYRCGAELDNAAIYFMRSALLLPQKSSPFIELSRCGHKSYFLHLISSLCGQIRTKQFTHIIRKELRTLGKLHQLFGSIFALIYDTVFNENYRKGNPVRYLRNQRWVFPDGVCDPFFDKDPAKRICKNLPRFVTADELPLFKFFLYWSGLRLITYIGCKIIESIDLDQFDEDIQIAVGGLSVGLAAGFYDSSHLTALARFLICVVTLCDTGDTATAAFKAACRLLAEVFGVLLSHFNRLFSKNNFTSVLFSGFFTDEMMASLIPISLLSHYVANFPTFFLKDAWVRRFSMETSFLCDIWAEMSILGNAINESGMKSEASDVKAVCILPEILNSFGISPVFEDVKSFDYSKPNEKFKINDEVAVRLFFVLSNFRRIAVLSKDTEYFTLINDMFVSRPLMSTTLEREYLDLPRFLPVPLKEIEDCVNSRRKEVDKKQAVELAHLVKMAKDEENKEDSLLLKKVVVIVKPQYLVIDSNSFIDGLDIILSLMDDPHLTILIPIPVIRELRGLRNKTTTAHNSDEEYAKLVCREATRSLEELERCTKPNVFFLHQDGAKAPLDMAIVDAQGRAKIPSGGMFLQNNDRLIIESARAFNDRVCSRSTRNPRGDIYIFRDVLLVTRDRIMMLLANGYRLPSLDIFSFGRWTGFSK